jgi:hypothetical protein
VLGTGVRQVHRAANQGDWVGKVRARSACLCSNLCGFTACEQGARADRRGITMHRRRDLVSSNVAFCKEFARLRWQNMLGSNLHDAM